MRAAAASALRPSRATSRASCTSGDTTTTTRGRKRSASPHSTSSAASNTTSGTSARWLASASRWSASASMRGRISAFIRASAAGSPNTRAPRAARFSVPSSLRTSAPKRLHRRRQPLAAGHHQLTGQLIGIHDHRATGRQQPGHRRLATRDAPGQADGFAGGNPLFPFTFWVTRHHGTLPGAATRGHSGTFWARSKSRSNACLRSVLVKPPSP
jgi:hypothetical protein